jgi:hypothetical protein
MLWILITLLIFVKDVADLGKFLDSLLSIKTNINIIIIGSEWDEK